MELGRSLNKVEDVRLMADYMGTSVEMEKAQWSVEKASVFVDAVKREFA